MSDNVETGAFGFYLDLSPRVEVKLEEGAMIPYYAHPGDAGLDLCSNTPTFTINPNSIVRVPSGISIALPKNYVGFVVPRSGLGSKGLTVANTPGTIDSGYRGEVLVALINLSDHPFTVEHGDRIAQLIVMPVAAATLKFVEEFSSSPTERGRGGFGSTGVK